MRKVKQLVKSALLLTFMLGGSSLLAQTTQTFTSSGTFTVPAGVYSVKVEAWGGGGAGGGVDGASGTYRAGGGGGGGAFVLNNSVSVTPGNNITVTVGAGGTGVSAADGNSGGQSSFGGLVTANGGAGGKAGNSGSNAGTGGAGPTGTYKGGNGAAATTGFLGYSGGGGGGAGNAGNGGNSTSNAGGTGGTGGGGTGANGLILGTGNGTSAAALSAGGSGGRSSNSTDRTGGNGFRGEVRVTYCVTYSLTSTSGVTPICVSAGQSDITINGMLPVGSYTVTYDRSLPAASGLTASMTVTTSGTGTFTATGLTSAGSSTITITQLASGSCNNSISTNNTATVTVDDAPATAGTISGSGTACASSNQTYSISAVSGATNYTWAVPTGWSINSGQGTTSINVTTGVAGQDGDITVMAENYCGANNPAYNINIAPDNSTDFTGYTTSSAKTSGNITVTTQSPQRRGYLKFMLNSIPSGADVTSATLSLTNNGSTNSSATNYVRGLGSTDPVVTGASTLYNTIGSGTNYHSGTWSATGTISLPLNATALTDMESQLSSPGFFALGLVRGSTNTYIFYGYGNGANSPDLEVDYEYPRNLSVSVVAPATANAGNDETVCSDIASYTLSNATASNYSSLLWSTAGSGSFDDATLLNPVYTPSSGDISAGSVILTLTANGNSPCGNIQDGMTLTFEVLPTANAGSNQSICYNSSATLNGSVGGSATGGVWSSAGDGSFSPSVTDLNAQYTPGPNDITNGSVVLTLSSSGSVSCSPATSNLTLTVIPAPSQPDPITGAPSSVCPNPTDGPYTLSTTATGATSYHWYLNPSTTGVNFLTPDGSSSIDVEFGTTVNSTYVIRVEGINSCGAGAYRSVMVRRSVSTPASVIGNAVACANTNNVAYSCTPVSGADSYEWTISGDATVTGTTENVTVNFGPAWTGGTLCVAAKVGCFTSSTKCMTLSPSITPAAIGAITGTFTACPNAVQTYSVANISGATYNWTTPSNSGVTQGAGTNSVEVTFQNNYNNVGNICVTVVSSCGVSTGPKCKTINPTVPKRPVSITGPSSGLCNGNVNYSVPPQAGMNFNWTTPGTIIGPNNTETINVQYGAFTTGQVCVSAYNACGTSPSRCMIVKGAPIAAASITPGLACANQNVTFTAVTTNIQGDFTLTWMYPNTATYVSGGGNTNDVTVTWGAAAGNVILMSSNACGSASKVQAVALDNCRLGEENSQSSAFSVYPNPVNDVLNLSFMAEKSNMVSVQIFDYSGKLIQKDTFTSENGLNSYQANISKLAPGLYIISITTENGVMQGKFMKN